MTTARHIHLERLLGRLLLDAHGYTVGRIEDVEAEPAGDEYLVTHVLVGSHGWLSRLLEFAHQMSSSRCRKHGDSARTCTTSAHPRGRSAQSGLRRSATHDSHAPGGGTEPPDADQAHPLDLARAIGSGSPAAASVRHRRDLGIGDCHPAGLHRASQWSSSRS